MKDYTELIRSLRNCSNNRCAPFYCEWFDKYQVDESCKEIIMWKAADAIEALQAELIRICKQLPKRGEWVEENRRTRSSQFVCSECHRTAYDPQPTRDKAWKKRCRYAYCPNCGAKMFASDTNVLNKNDTTDGPIITPCLGCSDYDGYGGCKSKGGCARAKMEVQDG